MKWKQILEKLILERPSDILFSVRSNDKLKVVVEHAIQLGEIILNKQYEWAKQKKILKKEFFSHQYNSNSQLLLRSKEVWDHVNQLHQMENELKQISHLKLLNTFRKEGIQQSIKKLLVKNYDERQQMLENLVKQNEKLKQISIRYSKIQPEKCQDIYRFCLKNSRLIEEIKNKIRDIQYKEFLDSQQN